MTALATAEPDVTETAIALDPAPMQQDLSQGLCLAHVMVKSPAYRIAMRKAEVLAETVDGTTEVVEANKMTGNKWIWNQHELFDKIAENGRNITLLLDSFSVSEGKPPADEASPKNGGPKAGGGGYRIMSMNQVPKLHTRLLDLIATRDSLIAEMQDKWWTEIVPAISQFFGKHFYQVRPYLPSGPDDLAHRYKVKSVYWPLTPLNPAKLSMRGLSYDQQQRFISSQEEEIKSLFRDRFQNLFDTVFGEVVEIAESIISGERDPVSGVRSGKSVIQTGHRKGGSIEPILAVLERVKNFSQFATPEVLELVDNACAALQGVTHQDLNRNQGKNSTTAAIKAAMAPLAGAVQQLWDLRKNATRSISL